MLMVFLLQAEYEEKIERVKNGARDCLSKVEIVDFPWPQALVVSIPPSTALPVLEIPLAVASSAGRCPGKTGMCSLGHTECQRRRGWEQHIPSFCERLELFKVENDGFVYCRVPVALKSWNSRMV